MLFNTYPFIFGFLPAVLLGYFLLHRLRRAAAANMWLALASLAFYGYWNIGYVPLLLGSMAFNYAIGKWLIVNAAQSPAWRKGAVACGIAGNAMLLGYCKYVDFFLLQLAQATGREVALLHIVLPLGISFFTFTQIAFLIDAFQGKVQRVHPVNYVLFVTFFPHLIAGPILHHGDMMPQFDRARNRVWNWKSVAAGIFMFCVGLFKKVVIADTLAPYADNGFAASVAFVDSWLAAWSYAFQLYFDFSGYCDMAVGIALLFNIRLPQNFNSPYKAVSITDFWRRWHMTLGRFLKEYIYIPLGGNRNGFAAANRNLLVTFLIAGLWHGAGWTFIAWGLLHGAGQAAQRWWTRLGRPLPIVLARLLTLQFVVVAWVLFRAEHWGQAVRLLRGMAGLNGWGMERWGGKPESVLFVLAAASLALLFPNSSELERRLKMDKKTALAAALLFVVSLLYVNRVSPFIYFNF